MVDSNRSPDRRKPSSPGKPRPDFPLNIHKGTGYWCKKINGHVYYFGSVADDPKGVAALEKYLREKDDLQAGREPRDRADEKAQRIGDLCNQFLAHKESLRDSGELNARTFWGYHATCAGIVKEFGRNRAVVDLTPNDFRKFRATLAKTRRLVALGNEIMRVRSVFKFAYDENLIPTSVRFGQAFSKPDSDNVDKERNEHRMEHGLRMFEADEIRAILAACGRPLKAMVLLAINCGFGQTDCSCLPLKAVDLETRWCDFPRPKTGVVRRVALWPETVEAIREWIPMRPKAKTPADAGLLFLTVRGARWVKLNATGSPCDALGQEFGKVLDKLGLIRSRRSFYAMRHTFETVAGETTDQIAVDVIMGHKIKGMAANYIERIGDDRLRRVVDHVRAWLLAEAPDNATDGEPDTATLPMRDPSAPSDLPERADGAGPALRLFAG